MHKKLTECIDFFHQVEKTSLAHKGLESILIIIANPIIFHEQVKHEGTNSMSPETGY